MVAWASPRWPAETQNTIQANHAGRRSCMCASMPISYQADADTTEINVTRGRTYSGRLREISLKCAPSSETFRRLCRCRRMRSRILISLACTKAFSAKGHHPRRPNLHPVEIPSADLAPEKVAHSEGQRVSTMERLDAFQGMRGRRWTDRNRPCDHGSTASLASSFMPRLTSASSDRSLIRLVPHWKRINGVEIVKAPKHRFGA